MEQELYPAVTCPCSLSPTKYGTFSIYGGKRGGFAENVLEYMPPGPWYIMSFDKENHTLTIQKAPTP